MVGWPHSPVHRLAEAGAYRVTCGTYMKQHHFQSSERLRLLCETLQRLATKYGWNLQAWAVFSNHYHWVGPFTPGPGDAANLGERAARGNVNHVEPGRPHTGVVRVKGEMIGVRALARFCVAGNSRRRRAALQGGLRPQNAHNMEGTSTRRWWATWRWAGRPAG